MKTSDWLYILFVCILSMLAAEVSGVTDERTRDFVYGTNRYTMVSAEPSLQREAETHCRKHYKGRLAFMDSISKLRAVSRGLLQSLISTKAAVVEIWLGGRSDLPDHKSFSLEEHRINVTGERCVVASNWKTSPGSPYELFVKDCKLNERIFLCESPTGMKFSFFLPRPLGHCFSSNTIIRGYISMTAVACAKIGGTYTGTSRDDQPVTCFLDWCGTNRSDFTGLVFARSKRCQGNGDATLGGINTYTAHCELLGGTPAPARSPWKWTTCLLDWCVASKLNRDTYALSGIGNCPAGTNINGGYIFTQVYDCLRMGGEPFGEADDSTWSGCNIQICRLGKDCKKTVIAKEYRGTLAKTVSGRTCQRWDTQHPHKHANTVPDWFPENDVTAASNFCRNPADWAEGPFCYTTDPNVQWELCDIPFCKGSGPQVLEFRHGYSHYIFVPGLHQDPGAHCRKSFGAQLAAMETARELDHVGGSLLAIIARENMTKIRDITVGGKTDVPPGGRVDASQIDFSGNTGQHCVLLSAGDGVTEPFTSSRLTMSSQACPRYKRYFLCESREVVIQDMILDGETLRQGITDEFTCRKSCEGTCGATSFSLYTDTCWHHDIDTTACTPGKEAPGVVTVSRTSCDCNLPLVTGPDGVSDSAITAFSAASNSSSRLHGPWRARLDTPEETINGTVWSGGWVPTESSQRQWIQIRFERPREVYGIITQGSAGFQPQWVMSYKVSFSRDCRKWTQVMDRLTDNQKIFPGNRDAISKKLNILERVVYAMCVRLRPVDWHSGVGLRLEIIGCLAPKENIALGRVAYSSPAIPSAPADKAVDGFRYTTYRYRSCFSAPAQRDPWWAVDLGHVFKVTRVKVTNRGDCCGGRLHDFSIKVGLEFSKVDVAATLSTYQTCASVSGAVAQGATTEVLCSPPQLGRFLAVTIPGPREVLTLCEVQVYGESANMTNLALHKNAYQSSTAARGLPGNAVDGLPDANFVSGSCSSTAPEKSPWWVVDLAHEYEVHEVMVTNRGDCCGQRLHSLIIGVAYAFSTDASFQFETCATVMRPFKLGETKHIACRAPVRGRFVKLLLPGFGQTLTLCEVQVYGVKVPVETYGGNGERELCSFPFNYNNVSHDACIEEGRPRLWCSTTPDYDLDARWGYCMDVKLVDGRGPREGRVEVLRHGSWGTVCGDGWDDEDADVVCKQLGYEGGAPLYPPALSPGRGEIYMDDVRCLGDEAALADCVHVTSGGHNCNHNEDVAVSCWFSEQDGSYFVGYGAFLRDHLEDWSNRTILLTSSVIAAPGSLTSWTVYLARDVEALLQIWRPLSAGHYALVSSSLVSSRVPGKHTIYNAENHIDVQPGDVLGIAFRETNPVPFDYSFLCREHRVAYAQNGGVFMRRGDIVAFVEKGGAGQACKVFSLYATINREDITPQHDFQYAASAYRVIDDVRSRDEAAESCHVWLGQESTLLDINSEQEFVTINSKLVAMESTGPFWLNSSTSELDPVENFVKWGKCQPDESNRCLTLASYQGELVEQLGREFFFYTDNCLSPHRFICERNDSSVGPLASNILSGSLSQTLSASGRTQGHVKNAIIGGVMGSVAAVCFLLAVIFIIRWRLRRRTFNVASLMSGLSESTSPLHEGMENPVYAVQHRGHLDDQYSDSEAPEDFPRCVDSAE